MLVTEIVGNGHDQENDEVGLVSLVSTFKEWAIVSSVEPRSEMLKRADIKIGAS